MDGVVVDQDGNVYLAGTMTGAVDFGGGPVGDKSETRTYVVGYLADGVYRWSVDLGSGTSLALQKRLAIDAVGNLTVVSNPAYSYDGIPMANWRPDDALTVSRISASGSPTWHVTAVDSNNDLAAVVTVDGRGNSYVAGLLNGRIGVGQSSQTADREYEMFVTTLAAEGACPWIMRIEGDYPAIRPTAIVSNESGTAMYLAGTFEGTLRLPGQTVASVNRNVFDGFLFKMRLAD